VSRRLPIIPTLVVAAAVLTMIGLGVWQLRRAEWKADLIARYEQAQAMSSNVPLPQDEAEAERSLFRWSQFDCTEIYGWSAVAGRNAMDEPGYAHVARCRPDGMYAFDAPQPVVEVALGWSRGVEHPDWRGGKVAGILSPGGAAGWRLLASSPLPGLEALAPPDPNDLPNNHLMYASQWFFFALTALVIYGLALRKKWRG
jgi:surfeit locus 1 family protein